MGKRGAKHVELACEGIVFLAHAGVDVALAVAVTDADPGARDGGEAVPPSRPQPRSQTRHWDSIHRIGIGIVVYRSYIVRSSINQ